MNLLSSHPILRLTIPLATGIFLSDIFLRSRLCLQAHGIALTLLLGFLIYLLRTKSYRYRWLFGGVLYTFLLITGSLVTQLKWKQTDSHWPDYQVYKGFVLEPPEIKAKTVSCLLETQRRKVLLHIVRDSASLSLKTGDEMLYCAKIRRPKNAGNPYEFDYAEWLLRQGVSGTGYVVSGKWEKLPSRHGLSLKQHALVFRQRIVELFRSWHYEDGDFAVLSALTIGYKEALTDELREDFAVAGISHVLAISGLHVGILWALLTFLFRPLDKRSGGRIVKWALITSILWGYAFIAGLAASIVRAVTMCMLIELGHIRNNSISHLNILAVTAFFMLLYNPFYLFDVSFQLSFMAVLFILLFYRPLFNLLQVKNRLLRYFWGVICLSVTAQWGIVPLVMHYFSNFSVYFLFTNLIVAPLIPVIMYLAAAALAFFPIPLLSDLFVLGLKYAIRLLTGTAEWVSGLPYSSVSSVFYTSFGTVVLYLLIVSVFVYMVDRKRLLFIRFLGAVFMASSFLLLQRGVDGDAKRTLVFYHMRNCPAIHLIERDGSSYLVVGSSGMQKDRFRYIAKSYWRRRHLLPPQAITANYRDENIWTVDGLISWHGKLIGRIDDDYWKNKETDYPLDLDILYLCKGFEEDMVSLRKLFDAKQIVLDASMNEYRRKRLKSECIELNLPVFDIAEKGSFQIYL